MPPQRLNSTHADPRRNEWLKCSLSFPYWLDSYGHIYDATKRRWFRFRLWPAQWDVAKGIAPATAGAIPPRRGEASHAIPAASSKDLLDVGARHSYRDPPPAHGLLSGEMPDAPRGPSGNASPLLAPRLFVILKARQLGMTWLAVGFALWLMLFRPAATVLLFSKRDDEAVHLLRLRLRGMYERLPEWMRARSLLADNDHELILSNGSAARAFPTTGGRSYTATMALVDEADHVGELDRLLDAVKPTIDAGGWLILLSTADKAEPGSPFKRIYQAAQRGENGYTPIFLPWHARPDRTPEWYEAIRRDYLARDGTPDALHGEYPASDVEALAGRQADRRFHAEWLRSADDTANTAGIVAQPAEHGLGEESKEEPKETSPNPLIPAPGVLRVFAPPVVGHTYVIGADPAEGNPQSDESAASVVDALSGEQVAVFAGRYEPAVFAAGLADAAWFYNGASILVERNNHGHAVLLWLVEHKWDWVDPAQDGRGKSAAGPAPYAILRGWDGRPGWLSSGRGKALAFDAAADAVREGQTRLRDRVTLEQMLSIRGATLSAPQGERDDRAVAHVLALAALRWCDLTPAGTGISHVIQAPDPIAEADAGGFG